MNRRDFLRRSAGLSGLSAAPLSSWLTLQGLSRLAAQSSGGGTTGYRALVCFFFTGGNDSFNMLVPRPSSDPTSNWGSADEYEWGKYKEYRSAVNLPNLNPGTPLGQVVLPLYKSDGSLHAQALNANMPRLAAIFNNSTSYVGAPSGSLGFTPSGRHAAFLTNVGTLVEPVTAAEVRNRSRLLPLYLQSHADQVSQWHSCFPQGQLATGWGGRLMDEYASGSLVDPLSMISLDGTNLSLTGARNQPFSDSNGSPFVYRMSVNGYTRYAKRCAILKDFLSDQATAGTGSLLADAYVKSVAGGLSLNEDYADIIGSSATPEAGLPNIELIHGVVGNLRRVAHIIDLFRTRGTEPKRQIFFVNFGGWDHHNGLGPAHSLNLRIVDSAIAEFYKLLQDQGALNDVTLFTASDFGRGLVPNGDGSDHAWGGNHFVLGGAVGGGKIYGEYPKMKIKGTLSNEEANDDDDNLDIYGNGVMTPSLSVDQYFQRMARWFLQNTDQSGWLDDVGDDTPEWSSVFPNWSSLKGFNRSRLSGFMGI